MKVEFQGGPRDGEMIEVSGPEVHVPLYLPPLASLTDAPLPESPAIRTGVYRLVRRRDGYLYSWQGEP